MPLLQTRAIFLLFGILSVGPVLAQAPNVDQIMSQIAVHQDQAEQLRAKYAYTQKVRIRALRGNGKFSREEYYVYNVAPTGRNTEKQLALFKGRYVYKGHVVEYSKPGEQIPNKKIDIDADILPALRDCLVNNKESKDGLGKDLFWTLLPLNDWTGKERLPNLIWQGIPGNREEKIVYAIAPKVWSDCSWTAIIINVSADTTLDHKSFQISAQ